MSMKNKFQNWFYLDEEEEQRVENKQQEKPREEQRAVTVTNAPSKST